MDMLAAALSRQQAYEGKLGEHLVQMGYINERQLLKTLSDVWNIPLVSIEKFAASLEVFKRFPFQLLRKFNAWPVEITKQNVTLAMADPFDSEAISELRLASGLIIDPVLASRNEINEVLDKHLILHSEPSFEETIPDMPINSLEKGGFVDEINSPLIRMVNSMLKEAVQLGSSDIHIEPQANFLQVRLRIDGRLFDYQALPQKLHAPIISRLKLMSGIDIAEKRTPQDGRMLMDFGNVQIDFRVATLPTFHGEKMVLRILDKQQLKNCIEELGLSQHNLNTLIELSARPHGLILVTGPTGSGKTTTLYSMLNKINSIEKNIVTIEDPIEYTLPGINQVQTNIKAGLTFASGLRSILRQDPDVIMVGEIRDRETAELAVHMALTGHLVLSTLHTNSAIGSIARLIDMGIERYLLASALIGVISQRLIRKLCDSCKEKFYLTSETIMKFEIDCDPHSMVYRAVGCGECRNIGYQGRIAIQEIMIIGPQLKALVEKGALKEEQLCQVAESEGLVSIKQDGFLKVIAGISSLEEVLQAVLLS